MQKGVFIDFCNQLEKMYLAYQYLIFIFKVKYLRNFVKINLPTCLPLQLGQQIPRLGSGGLGSVQFKVGQVGGRQVTTPC